MNDKLKNDRIYSTNEQLDVKRQLGDLFQKSTGSNADKLGAYMKFITRQDMSLFIARYEIFKQVLDIKGSIIECGVYYGSGLMTYAQLSAGLEPINYNRRIIGFDTFEGNAGMSSFDKQSKDSESISQATYSIDTEAELRDCIKIYDSNRFLNHIPKVELVRGDIVNTLPQYLQDNSHLMVSILELTVNLYEPTRIALNTLLPRMTKGSIIALNTLNEGVFPGVTLALLKEVRLSNVCIRSFPYCPNLSYLVI